MNNVVNPSGNQTINSRVEAPSAQQSVVRQPAQEAASAASVAKLSPGAVESLVADMQAKVDANERNVRFRVDKQYDTTVISVVDAITDDVIREIPSEDLLKLSQMFEAGQLSTLDLKV